MPKPQIKDIIMGTVTVGERGQIVIPVEARKEFSIKAGEKLLMLGHPSKEGLVFVKLNAMKDFIAQLASGLSEMENTFIESISGESKGGRTIKNLAGIILPIFGLLCLCTGAQAQKLTIDDAVATALQNNPKVSIAKAKVTKAQGYVKQTMSAGKPQVSVNGNYLRNDQAAIIDFGGNPVTMNPLESKTASLAVNQVVDVFGVVRTTNDAAAYSNSAAKYDATSDINGLVFETKTAFFNVLRARSALKVQEETVASYRAHLKQTQAFYDAGTVPKFDLIKAQAALANAMPALIQAQNAVRTADSDFNRVLGRPLSVPVEVEEPARPSYIDANVNAVTDAAVKSNPMVLMAGSYTGMQGKIADARKLQSKPTVGLNWTMNQCFDAGSRANSWTGLVRATWSIFDGGLVKGQVEQAESDYATAKAQQDQVVQGTRLQAQQAYFTLKQDEERIKAAEVAVEQAQEALRIAQLRYKNGLSTQLEVLDSETAATAANTSHVNALYDYHTSRSRLEYVLGGAGQLEKLLSQGNSTGGDAVK
jgi:outer membrane protein